jgi:hypothetical protein
VKYRQKSNKEIFGNHFLGHNFPAHKKKSHNGHVLEDMQ